MKLTDELKRKYKILKNKTSAAIDAFCGYDEDDVEFNGFDLDLSEESLDDIVSHSIQRRITDFTAVKNENGRTVAMDANEYDDTENNQIKASVNNRFDHFDGTNITDQILSYYSTKGFMGYQAAAILGQNKWISKAICMPVEDSLRPGFNFVPEDETNNDNMSDILKKLKEISDKMNFNKKMYQWMTDCREFGVAYALPIIEDDEWDLSQPFNIDGVKKGTYKGIKIIDPFWMRPMLTSTSAYETCNLDFFEPDYYTTADCKQIHKSHIIKIIYKEVPDILKPTYYYGGMSLTQLIYEQVFLAEQTSMEAPKLVQQKRLLVLGGSIEESIRNTQRFQDKLKALLEARNNYGVYLTDINENVQQIETSLMEFPELISTQYLLIAGIAEIPYTKFLGTTPKGFNATGEYEMKSYIQMLKSLQAKFDPLIRRHIDLLSMSLFGHKQDVSFKFNEIDMPTERENAEVNSIQTQTINALLESGVISAEEARKWIKRDENSDFTWLDDDLPDDVQMQQEMENVNAGNEETVPQGENSEREPGNKPMVSKETA